MNKDCSLRDDCGTSVPSSLHDRMVQTVLASFCTSKHKDLRNNEFPENLQVISDRFGV